MDKRAELHERGLHFHDLRGTAITKLYNAGVKPHMIAKIVGWGSGEAGVQRLLDTYVSGPEMMRETIRQIERFENENRKTDSKTGGAR